ncbi:hypothetical protein MOO45_02855 [Bombilactobacillus folatiphilus]|uniref:Phage protein n=1 Tax=Bombilactobacillus folatiphilus TaxID=2923362 RepID=A0ABY4PAD8_9LACO|nr:hypothetical protein [Bombilactobacillus folatiphilus]UQS82604.1 hypothetical protein MOO45_02855 [Bombilactobacillus folatiphilus]
MRKTNDVKFYIENSDSGGYNPITGEYDDGENLVATLPANVTDLSIDRAKQLFGDILDVKKVVRAFKPVDFDWSYCVINDIKYQLTTQTNTLNGSSSLIVGRING